MKPLRGERRLDRTRGSQVGATRCARRCTETGLGALGRAAGRGPPGMFAASLGGELGPSASNAGGGSPYLYLLRGVGEGERVEAAGAEA